MLRQIKNKKKVKIVSCFSCLYFLYLQYNSRNMVPIIIKNALAGEFIEFLTIKKKGKLNQIQQLQNEVAEIDAQIEEVNAGVNNTEDEPATSNITVSAEGYSKDFTWFQKTVFALRQLRKVSTSTEIVNALLKIDAGLNKRRALSSVSSILSVKTTDDKNSPFYKDLNERNENMYGLAEWNGGGLM